MKPRPSLEPVSRWSFARLVAVLFEKPIGMVLSLLGYLTLGLTALWQGAVINGEGLALTRASRGVWESFFAHVFFLRMRPVCVLLYALPARFGHTVFVTTHWLVSATTFFLLPSLARKLGLRWVNLPNWLCLASTAMVSTAVSGETPSDGLVGVLLVAWLWLVHERRFLAGLLAGLLPLVRPELALLPVLLGGYSLWRERSWRFVFGAALLPLIYVLAGAVYHHDLAWVLHYPPNPATGAWGRGGPDWVREISHINLRSTLVELLLFQPFWVFGVLGLVEVPSGKPRVFVWFSAIVLVLLNVLPNLGLFGGFGASYTVTLLGLMGLWAALVTELSLDKKGRARYSLVVGSVVMAGLGFAALGKVSLSAVVAWAVVALGLGGAVFAGQSSLVAVALLLGVLVSRAGFAAGSNKSRQIAEAVETARWLHDHEGLRTGRKVYTNSRVLQVVYEYRYGHPADGTAIVPVMQDDMKQTLRMLTNASNGQTAELIAAWTKVDGMVFDGASLTPDSVRADSLLVLENDYRLWLTFHRPSWEPRLRSVTVIGRNSIFELQPAPGISP